MNPFQSTLLRLTVAVICGLIFSAAPDGALATTANTQGLAGSAHDFGRAIGKSAEEMCAVCHTPHRTDTQPPPVPLWDTSMRLEAYPLFGKTWRRDAPASPPRDPSLSCLSCHDGILAADNQGLPFSPAHAGEQQPNGSDIHSAHTVGLIYDAELAARRAGLYDPTRQPSGLGGTIAEDLLINHRMECASCHDVHNAAGVPKMLRKSNRGSQLCFTCHDK